MRIRSLQIENYKSLKHIQFSPGPVTALIGPNGSGKSNIASALDFLSDLYESGVEYAIARKGGYENIAFRKQRRTKSGISFKILFELDSANVRFWSNSPAMRSVREKIRKGVLIEHEFCLRTIKQDIRSDFYISSESVRVIRLLSKSNLRDISYSDSTDDLFVVRRIGDDLEVISSDEELGRRVKESYDFFNEYSIGGSSIEQELVLNVVLPRVSKKLSCIGSYQFSPQISRSPGVPSPQPRLSGYGQNLPAVVDWLRRKNHKKWVEIQSGMREIIPNLDDIVVSFLHTKTLGLYFQEKGFGRAWAAEDVSDGTIQALAILCAIYDPRNDFLFIDELENSVHPWIVREIFEKIKSISDERQIVLATHSPVILNLMDPENVWVTYKVDGETRISRLSDLSDELMDDWSSGMARLFELLDSGIVAAAVPGGV